MVLSGTNLYVGGTFSSPSYYMKIYNTVTKTWSNPSTVNHPNFDIYCMALSGNDIYIGGQFASAATGNNRITKYNIPTNTWSPLGNGLNGFVYSIVVSGNDIYAGGNFTVM